MYFRDVAMEKRFLHYVYMKTQEFITCCIYFVIHGNVTSMFFECIYTPAENASIIFFVHIYFFHNKLSLYILLELLHYITFYLQHFIFQHYTCNKMYFK